MRVVAVGDETNVCPCGGTHVRSAADVVGLRVTAVRVKKGVTKVCYDLLPAV